MDYFRLIQRAIDMIEENILEKMYISDLADAAYCSEAHFSRIFRSIVGMSIMDYIRCRKLSLAGRELAFTKTKVIDTALKYGYETPEAFAKAFKKYHGITPIQCRRTCSFMYQERSFPLVVKMKLMEGAVAMSGFGSPLQQIIEDLDKSSRNMYYCFNFCNTKYAIKAIEVWEINSLKGLYLNTRKELCLFLRGNRIPVIRINGIGGIGDASIGRHNILVCGSNPPRSSQVNPNNSSFGLIIEGNPELKIIKSIKEIENPEIPYISSVGQFDGEQVKIISINEFRSCMENKLAAIFDKSEEIPFENLSEDSDVIKRLEYAAYDAELLARNASIEAAHGMQHHKGTMVVAYELHQHAVEIAKIARELRERNI